MSKYSKMTDQEKKKLIHDLYTVKGMSFIDISKNYDTYPNKLRRDAIKFDIAIRNKSEAQKNALEKGSHKHPTKGTKRSNDTKSKIGIGVMKSWENMDPQDLEQRKNKSKELWEKLDENDKANILQKANSAVRESSKHGSKLEKFILNDLLKNKHKVDFHKEQILSNTKLQIDLFLPKMNVAIEVDGPSHFVPVWGDQALARNKTYDNKKTGLILGKGWKLIRIKQNKDFSKTRAQLICDKLNDLLNNINNSSDNLFELGDI
jgi:very-short-patch-repair endonuclease